MKKGSPHAVLLGWCEVKSIVNVNRIVYVILQVNNQGFVQVSVKSVMIKGVRVAVTLAPNKKMVASMRKARYWHAWCGIQYPTACSSTFGSLLGQERKLSDCRGKVWEANRKWWEPWWTWKNISRCVCRGVCMCGRRNLPRRLVLYGNAA